MFILILLCQENVLFQFCVISRSAKCFKTLKFVALFKDLCHTMNDFHHVVGVVAVLILCSQS